MIRSQEQDEFIAVRVQDPRLQNEGSWNSYVDFKIFLHTNSKAFTAKTSCVRRRYSEFVWLKKKLQKNAGLVPVPDLPRKSIFSFINDDFIERRRKGLQTFLDKVLHMTVCLSDSQLHLFLQTQLPVKHIEDCVQGHTPYTVTEAILTYASSNQGWVQEEGAGDPESWPVPYESVESPTPHVPVGAVSIKERPRNDPSDFSEVELSDVEKTEPDSVINLIVEVHQKHPVENIDGEESGPEPTQLEKNGFQNFECENPSPALPIEKPQYGQPQNQGLIEVLDEDEVRVIENRTLGDEENNTEGQEAEPEQKDIDKNLLQKDLSLPSVDYDEITLDLIAVQEDNQEQTDKVLGSSIHSIDAPHEDVKICDESLMDTKVAEEKNDVVQQNKAGDEDFTASPVQEMIRSETSWEHSEIKETCLSSSSSDSDEDDVSEVNKLNAKHAQTERAVLILEGIEEGLKMETDPVTEIMHNISPVSNLDANIAQLDSLVL